MTNAALSTLLLSTLLVASCGGSSSAPVSPRVASLCETDLRGRPMPTMSNEQDPGPPTGGTIADGDYELVNMVTACHTTHDHTGEVPGAFRVLMRFTSTERGPNYQAGNISTFATNGVPPTIVACESGTFTAYGTTIDSKGLRAEASFKAGAYSATPNGILFHASRPGNCDVHWLRFRRL